MPNFKHKDVLSGECTDCSRARVAPWQRSLPYLLIALLTAACGSTGSGEEGDTQPPGNEAPVAVAYGVSTWKLMERDHHYEQSLFRKPNSKIDSWS